MTRLQWWPAMPRHGLHAAKNTPTRESDRAPVEAAVTGTVDSQTLLRGGSVIHILHNGETYRLRVTKRGKLILTK